MKRPNRLRSLLRIGSSLAIIVSLASGVTFAALRTQNNVLSGSRMTSASANLNIARLDNGQWFTSITGFNFNDIVPGGAPGPITNNDLYFFNGGSTNLDLRFGVNLSKIVNPNGLNLSKVKVVVVDGDGVTVFAGRSLTELGEALGAGTPLPVNLTLGKNSTTHLKVMMQLEDGASANTTSQVELSNLDIVFSGVAI